jgi:ankyrin repeat protein
VLAICQRFSNIIKLLVLYGAETNKVDCSGWSALHWACFNTSREIVKVHLAVGADVNIVDEDGDSPLYFAARDKDKVIIRLLTAANANVNEINNLGRNPLFDACVCDASVALIRYLISIGSDVNCCDKTGNVHAIIV